MSGKTEHDIHEIHLYKSAIKLIVEENSNSHNELASELLHHSAWQGHFDLVKLLLSNGADINSVDSKNWNALMLAIGANHEDIAEYLINKNININYQGEDGWNALMVAARSGSIEIVKTLLEKNIDLNMIANKNITALMIASINGHQGIVEELIKKGAKINCFDSNAQSALDRAKSKNHLSVIDLIKKYGGLDKSEIVAKIKFGNDNELNNLLNSGVDIDLVYENGETALIIAVIEEKESMCKILLDKGADKNHQNLDGKDAEYYASVSLSLKIKKLLGERIPELMEYIIADDLTKIDKYIKSNGNVNVSTLDGTSALLWTIYYNKTTIGEILIEAGANCIQTTNDLKDFPLLAASSRNLITLVKSMVNKGVNVNTEDTRGIRPIHHAAMADNHEIIEILIDAGAEIDARVKVEQHWTPLMLAASRGNYNTCEVLINRGANLNAIDACTLKKSVLAYARPHKEVYELLKRKGAIEYDVGDEIDKIQDENERIHQLQLLVIETYLAKKRENEDFFY